MLRPAFLLLLFTPLVALAQKQDRRMIKALQTDIAYLSATAAPGEHKAADYLVTRYEKLQIPAYGAGYRHPFRFTNGLNASGSKIVLGGQSNMMGGEAFPLPFSGTGAISGEVLIEVQELGAIWMLPLYANAGEAAAADFDWERSAWTAGKQAIRDGAAGVVFYANYDSRNPPQFNPLSKHEKLAAPMACIGYRQWQELSGGGANMISVAMDIQISTPERNAANIAAWIDNKAPHTILIGAHLHQQHEPGTEDGATGTAAVLQLAEWLKKSRLRRYNYLFVHLAGEAPGQLAAAAFSQDPGVDSSRIAAMIELDMMGRLNDTARILHLDGLADSKAWEAVPPIFQKAGLRPETAAARKMDSDAVSFRRKSIPTLRITTGAGPATAATAAHINYAGESSIITALQSVLRRLDGQPKPRFEPSAD
jgi:hypothetical protein